jgi:hypothetical protein
MKTEIEVPESLDDITLEQYQKFQAIPEPTNDDLLSIFLNIPIEQINIIKSKEADKLIVHLNDVLQSKQEHVLRFDLKGTEFGFIPRLDDISYGENNDITAYIGNWKEMHKAMAVLYRPILQKKKDKYLIVDYNGSAEYSEFMKQMPLSVVFGSIVFFCDLTNELLTAIPNYLEKVMKQEQMSGQVSEQNGEDFKKLILLLKETLDDMMRLQTYHSINA